QAVPLHHKAPLVPVDAGDDFRRPFGGGADLVHAGAVQDGAAHGPGEAVDVQLDAQIPEFQRGAGGGFGQAAGVHNDVGPFDLGFGWRFALRGLRFVGAWEFDFSVEPG